MDYGSQEKIEEEEIIEHYVSESRRLCGVDGTRGPVQEILTETIERRYNEELPSHDFYRTSQSSLQATSSLNNEAERRYYATGERDCSRDTSFMQTSGISSASHLGSASVPIPYLKSSSNLDRSVANIDSYGYDVHEVHTSKGGARIVQTHGTGLIHSAGSTIQQTERSLNQHRIHSDKSTEHQRTTLIQEREHGRSRIPSPVKHCYKEVGFLGSARPTVNGINASTGHRRKTIYTLPSPSTGKAEISRHVDTLSSESKLSRKDSYKRMQMGQQDDSADAYAPRSDASLIAGFTRSHSQSEQMLTAWERVVQFIRKILFRASFDDRLRSVQFLLNKRKSDPVDISDTFFRNTTWTPRLICLLLLFLLLVTVFFILLGILFNALFGSYSVRTLSLYPPLCENCNRLAPSGVHSRIPSVLHIRFYSSSQVHFELIGNPPFKSNSFCAIDFETGYIAIADHALVDSSGRHTTCFLMPLDQSTIPSMSALRDALSSVSSEIYSEYGWQEYWQYQAEAIDTKNVERKFTNKIGDCGDAKWYLLKHTVYTKDSRCSNCYDFCVPEYAIQRLHKYEDDMTIGIRRLDCFRLYVGEWASYQLTPDSQGGHWSYPRISSNTQRDSSGNWVHWDPTG
uniref:BRICHOS domain-containing protein n=1 Tax=Setaria digitata TaxID=48799 RepID=A0A915PKP9_9BILA